MKKLSCLLMKSKRLAAAEAAPKPAAGSNDFDPKGHRAHWRALAFGTPRANKTAELKARMGQEGKNHHPPTSARHNARCFLCFAASPVTTLLSTGARHVSVCACPASLKSSGVFMRFAVSYVVVAQILWKLLFNEPWQRG